MKKQTTAMSMEMTMQQPAPEALQVICAWCGVIIKCGALPVSHGLCQKCKDRLEQEIA